MEIVTNVPKSEIKSVRSLEYPDCASGCKFHEVLVNGRLHYTLPAKLDCELCLGRIVRLAVDERKPLLWGGAVA